MVKLNWSYHPALSGKRVWLHRLPRFLRRDRETLDPAFPAEFSELLASTGQAGEEHEGALKVRELWQARISHLNTWVIPDRLVATRFWTALMEVSCVLARCFTLAYRSACVQLIDIVIVALFVAALAVTRGKQEVRPQSESQQSQS